MNLENGLDSAFAPNITQVQVAVNQQYIWWGYYLPKLPNTDPLNGWTIQQVDELRTYGITPLPICVPAPPHPADPVQTATEYFNLAKQYGHDPKVSILYNGEHISAIGPVWLPIPGPAPTSIGDQSAIQYATTTLGGLGVDLSKSVPDFPVVSGIVVDLEANASYTSAWYQTFQSTIIQLAGGSHMASAALPATAYPIKDSSTSYDGNQIHLFITGADHVYHKWFAAGEWNGPQIMDEAV